MKLLPRHLCLHPQRHSSLIFGTELDEAQGQLLFQTCVPARLKSSCTMFRSPDVQGYLHWKNNLYTIQISLTTQQQWHSACRESQQSTNVVNSSLISFPFLFFRYLDICTHVAGATREHYTAIILVTTSVRNILNETFTKVQF